MKSTTWIRLLIAVLFLNLVVGSFCGALFPATVTPFADLTCPSGTEAYTKVSTSTFDTETRTNVSLTCRGDGGTEMTRALGAAAGKFLHHTLISLILIAVGWAGLRLVMVQRESTLSPVPLPSLNLEGDMRLRELIAAQKRLDAIKYVREMTGIGLKEAKDYVERLSNQTQSGSTPMPETTRVSLAAAANDFEVLDWLTGGQKIKAIKRVRELTGIGLKEAKDFVEAIERGEVKVQDSSLTPSAPTPDASSDPFYDPQVREYLKQGKKIDAIKRVRVLTGVGLKQAKDLVESWEGRF